MAYPTRVTIETIDPVFIKHLMNCFNRQTNFRVNTRQFKVTDFSYVPDLEETVYTFKLYETKFLRMSESLIG
jgi:CRISPR/Cas system endoribonuclease Cas6 (RAMP superfamily)